MTIPYSRKMLETFFDFQEETQPPCWISREQYVRFEIEGVIVCPRQDKHLKDQHVI